MQKFAVDAVLIPFLRVLELFHLQIVFMNIAFEQDLHRMAEICCLLTDARVAALLGIVGIKKRGHGVKFREYKVSVRDKTECRIFLRNRT